MISPTGVYHTSFPADDLDRAERFYRDVIGLDFIGRVGENQSRFKCGDHTIVIFLRPRPLQRDSFKEDGVYHQSFEIPIERFDEAVETLKQDDRLREIVDRDSGKTVYFTDPEGNYVELHASK